MRLFLSLGLLFVALNAFPQGKLVGISKVSEGEVLLRWATNDIDVYRECNLNGFIIQKIVKKKFETISANEWNSENILSIVFPIHGNDSLWKKYYQMDQKYLLLRKILYPEEKETKEKEQSFYSMFLLSIDLDSSFARNSGLFYKDKIIEKDKKVFYRISTNGKTKLTLVMEVDPSSNTIYKKIDEFEVNKKGATIEMRWKHGDLIQDYSSYILERSQDSIHFSPITKENFIPFATQFEKEKMYSYFLDTTVELNQKYFYRITPVDHFGEKNICSQVKSVYVAAPVTTNIIIDSLYEKEPNKIKLIWHTQKEDEAINQFDILYTNKIDGHFKKVVSLGKDDFSFEGEISDRVNYFKVVAKNNYGDSISSWPEMILLPDRILPEKVEGLNGEIDSIGKVKLNWKKNPDKDLMGYRVFKSNARFEEFVEVSKKIIIESEFADSLFLETLTEEIYYLVTAVDSNYNNSVASDTLQLQKPDLIPPSAAPITRFYCDKKGNLIYWENSTSKDKEVTTLLSSRDGKVFNLVSSWNGKDTVHSFLDTNVFFNEGVYYKLRVVDDAGNFSDGQPVYIFSQRVVKEKSFNCEVKVNRDKKEIILQWDSPSEKVYSYSIYKSKKGELMRNFKTLLNNEPTFTDHELYISNTYLYSIKATLESGREVVIAEKLEVEY